MKLEILPFEFTVCKLANVAGVDITQPFTFLSVTDLEISLTCPTAQLPAATTHREDGWRCLRITGTLDFGLVGILARLTALLAAERISVFAVSTYDTDYLLVKKEMLPQAVRVFAGDGIVITGDTVEDAKI